MSSRAFRSVIRRREHHERHQPEARARFGLLEKKKDYVQRARNFHSKEKRLAALRKKAENRNPDEFYFGMLSSKTRGGVHTEDRSRARPALSADMLAVLKTQDKAYVSTLKSAEEKKVARLSAALHFVPLPGAPRPNRHTVFVDEAELSAARTCAGGSAGVSGGSSAEVSGGGVVAGAGAGAASAGSSAAAATTTMTATTTRGASKRVVRARDEAHGPSGGYAELAARKERVVKLRKLEAHMDLERALLRPGKRMKVADATGDAPAVYKWRAERKR
jgi:U3 small nucleolar RNA-associated protein 11